MLTVRHFGSGGITVLDASGNRDGRCRVTPVSPIQARLGTVQPVVTLLALASSAVWGTADFIGGLFSKRLNPIRVVALSQLGGLLAALVFFATVSMYGRHGSSPASAWFTWGFGAGVSGAIGLLFLYAALSIGTMGVVSPITALGAVVPVVLGLLRGDTWNLTIGAGLVVALAGALLASGPELDGEVGWKPVALACVSAVGFGFALYCMDGGARHDLSGAMLGMRCGGLSLLLPLLLIALKTDRAGVSPQRKELLGLPLLGAGDLTANLLFAAASAKGQVSVVAVLGSLYPVATLLWARFLLHERLRPVQLIGVALTVVGVVLVTV